MKRKIFKFIFLPLFCFLSSCDVVTNSQEPLYISKYPNITEYSLGDSFSLEGIEVINGVNGKTIYDYTSSIKENEILSSVGKQEVIISKTSYKSASFKINVADLKSLSITSLPKTEFQVGEFFSLEGLEVKNEKGEIVNDYLCSYNTGNKLTESGIFDVVISKAGYKDYHYSIHVEGEKALIIAQNPDKTNFKTGEKIDFSGLIVEDNDGNVIIDYETSITTQTTFKTAGTFTIVISKVGYLSTSYEINVTLSDQPAIKQSTLTFYYLNDTHGSFIRDRSNNEGGIAYIGKTMKDAKDKDYDHTFILSGGDMFQGGAESNLTKGKVMLDAMNYIGFDAMTLGNHEYDWGEEALISLQKDMDFPLLACNVFYSDDKTERPSYLSPYTIIERGDIKIGIIGAVKEGIGSSITGSISSMLYFPNPISYIKNYSDSLRNEYGCDLILLVTHDGSTYSNPTQYADLTENSPNTNQKYVNGIFLGHDHYANVGKMNSVAYLESGGNGTRLGEMTFDIEYSNSSFQITGSNSANHYSTSYCTVEDKNISNLVLKYPEITDDLDDVLCVFKKSYDDQEFAELVCQAMVWYVNEKKELFGGCKVYFGVHNSYGGIRDDVDAGAFTYRDLIKVLPFDNKLAICDVTSSLYKSMINYYASYSLSNVPTSGRFNGVTISYISENKYYAKYQWPEYSTTSNDALKAFLKSGAFNG